MALNKEYLEVSESKHCRQSYNFVAYFIIGLPVGYILALPLGVGVEGLWIGMTFGLVFVSTVNILLYLDATGKS